MKAKKLISALLSATMLISTMAFAVKADATTKSIAPTNRGGGVMTANADGTYTYKSNDGVTASSINIPSSKDYAITAEATDEKYIKYSFDVNTVTAGTSNELDLAYRGSDNNITNTRNTYNPLLSGEQNFDVIIDLSTGTAYMYLNDVLKKTDSSLASWSVFKGLVIYSNMSSSPTEYIFSNVTETVYSSASTLKDVQLDVVPDEKVTSMVPISRNSTQGTMTDNGDGTYTFTAINSNGSFRIPLSKTYAVTKDAEGEESITEKYVKLSANIKTITAGNSSFGINDGQAGTRPAKNLTGEHKIDFLADLSTGSTYIYVDGVCINTQTALTKDTDLKSGLAVYAGKESAQYVISNVTETVYSAAKTLEDVQLSVVPEKITKSAAPTARGGGSMVNNGDGTYTYTTNANTADSFNINTSKAYTISSGAFEQKYVKVSAQITASEPVNSYELAFNGGNIRSVATPSFKETKQLDVIVDLSTGQPYIYLDGTAVAAKKIIDQNGTFSGLTVYTNKPDGKVVTYSFANVTETVYSAASTLKDVQLETIPAKQVQAVVPARYGNSTVTENEDGTYRFASSDGGNYSSFRISFPTEVSLSPNPDEVSTKYARLTTTVEGIKTPGGDTKMRNLSDSGDQQLTTIKTGTKYVIDVVIDVDAKKLYYYENKVQKKSFDITKDRTDFMIYVYGLTAGVSEEAVIKLSDTYSYMYTEAVTLKDVMLDMVDDVISEESTVSNAGIPSGLSNWSVTPVYNATTDTVSVPVALESGIGRFTPLAMSMPVGKTGDMAVEGLYHFTTFWTVNEQNTDAYFQINVGSGSKYNTQGVSEVVGNKYENNKVANGRKYRIDVIVDSNDAAAPVAYIYRDGIQINKAELAGTELMGESVYTSFRYFSSTNVASEFTGTKAVIYKKNVKTFEDIEAQIIDEIGDSDARVTVANPTVKYADGKYTITTSFIGDDSNTDKYVAGYKADGSILFVVSPEAAAAGVTAVQADLAEVKVFAWENDTLEPAGYCAAVEVKTETK